MDRIQMPSAGIIGLDGDIRATAAIQSSEAMDDLDPEEPKDLLSRTAWTQALARSLVGDPSRADDLAQESWLAALSQMSGPARRRVIPRSWFRRVIRNLSNLALRGDAHRRSREEQVARPEAVPSAAEVVEQAERHRIVVEAVMELREPLRSTVLFRYFSGFSVAAIASRTGASPGAVRMRLSRALETLRTRMDQRYGADGRSWLLALTPLAARPIGTSAAGAGILLMSTKTTAISAAALFLLGGVWLAGLRIWSSGHSSEESPVELGGRSTGADGSFVQQGSPRAMAGPPNHGSRREADWRGEAEDRKTTPQDPCPEARTGEAEAPGTTGALVESVSAQLMDGSATLHSILDLSVACLKHLDPQAASTLDDGSLRIPPQEIPGVQDGHLTVFPIGSDGSERYQLTVNAPSIVELLAFDPGAAGELRIQYGFLLDDPEYCSAALHNRFPYTPDACRRLQGLENLRVGGIYTATRSEARWIPLDVSIDISEEGVPFRKEGWPSRACRGP